VAAHAEQAVAAGWQRLATALPKVVLAAILAIAILDMLAGVFLRYVVTAITDYLDLDPVSFFWAEEVGELALCWLTLIGAAVAILERTHFALAVLTHRFPPAAQRAVERVNHVLIAGFGVLVALYGWKVSLLNAMLVTPALQINLAILYFSAVFGGGLIALYGLGVAIGLLQPRQVALKTGPE
jgi:TRAP-type C4-dicarboxylate transport system permease small subunit